MRVRLSLPEDEPFILDCWLRSFRNSYYAGAVTFADWFSVMGSQLKKIMAVPGTVTHVAYGGTGKLVGFSCTRPERNFVLYVFVLQPFRAKGVARALLEHAGVERGFTYGFKTPVVKLIGLSPSKFDPLSARETRQGGSDVKRYEYNNRSKTVSTERVYTGQKTLVPRGHL